MVTTTIDSPSATLPRIAWHFPIIVLIARTVFLFVAQALVALGLLLHGTQSPWEASAAWWSVYASLADIGCLLLLAYLLRTEGKNLRDLVRMARPTLGMDVLIGFAGFVVLFPLTAMAGTMLSAWIVYGAIQPPLFTGLLSGRTLPFWGVVYSLAIWWPLWSMTEELTYQGYTLPRLEARTSWPLTVPVIAFWWALQHSFLPLVLSWQYVVYRFLAFVPVVLGLMFFYRRIGRLGPVIIAHALMDLMAAFWTLSYLGVGGR